MDVKTIIRIQEQGNLKAFANVVINEEFMIKGISVVDGKNGLFLNMPQKKGQDGKYYDQFYPIKKETREELTKAVIDEYQHQLSKTHTLESDKKTKKEAKQDQKQEEPAADDAPKSTRGRKPKQAEPEPDEEQGMAMGM